MFGTHCVVLVSGPWACGIFCGPFGLVLGLDPGSLGQVQLVLELIGSGLVGLDFKRN